MQHPLRCRPPSINLTKSYTQLKTLKLVCWGALTCDKLVWAFRHVQTGLLRRCILHASSPTDSERTVSERNPLYVSVASLTHRADQQHGLFWFCKELLNEKRFASASCFKLEGKIRFNFKQRLLSLKLGCSE